MRKLHWIAVWCLCALAVSATPVWADDPVVSIRNQAVSVDIRGRVATTTVEITYVNYTNRQQEATLRWRMASDVAVHDLAMWVDGMRSPAAILARSEAREIYREIVARQRDPALLENLGGGLWRLRVFPIPAEATQKVQMVFSQVLHASDGWVTYQGMTVISGSTAMKAQDFDFSAVIRCVGGVNDIKAGDHKLGVQRSEDGAVTIGFRAEGVKLSDPVGFSYRPVAGAEGPAVFAPKDGAAYFATTVPPAKALGEGKLRPRNIVVVIDTSGSMKGVRAATARTAATAVLKSLKPHDRFNVVLAGADARMWKDKLVSADKDNIAAAVKLIAEPRAHGGTDLAAGVRAAESFNTEPGKPFLLYVFSDGIDMIGAVPTTRPAKDKAKADPKATGTARGPNVQIHWFEIAAGKGMSDALSPERRVFVWTITGLEDLEEGLRESLAIAATPVITDIKVACEDAAGKPMRVAVSQLLADLPVTICGTFRQAGVITATVTCRVDGKPTSANYPIALPQPGIAAGASDDAGPALSKVWAHLEGERMYQAMRRDKSTIVDLGALIDHSRKHRVLTQATAFLVLENDEDYLRRGIERKVSFLPAGATLDRHGKKLTRRADAPSAIVAKRIARLKDQAKELRRLKRYAGAAEALEGIVKLDPTQIAARREAALLRQFVAQQAEQARNKGKMSPDEIKARRDLESRRVKRVETLIGRIRTLVGQKQFQDALDVSNHVLRLDPGHRYASEQNVLLTLVGMGQRHTDLQTLDDDQRRFLMKQIMMHTDSRRLVDVREASIPWYDFLRYPDDWREITRRREPFGSGAMGESEVDHATRVKLRQKIDGEVDFDRTPFKDAIDFLRNVSGANIQVKWKTLEDEGVDDTAEVKSVKAIGVTVERLLRLVLHDVGGKRKLGFVIDEGVVVISTKTDLAKHTDTRVYDIRDLLVEIRDFEGPRLDLHAVRANAGGGLFGDDDDNDGDPTTRDELAQEIVELIKETISPNSWRPNAGIGAVNMLNGQLVITQTLANHRDVLDLLHQLREAKGLRIALDARFVALIAGGEPFPERMFTRDGHITPWVEQLLAAARTGKLSKFSSVRVVKVGGRRFARIGGIWLDVSLTREARIHLVRRDTAAAASLAKAAPDLRACFRLGTTVVVAADAKTAVALDTLGLSKTKPADLKKIIKALATK